MASLHTTRIVRSVPIEPPSEAGHLSASSTELRTRKGWSSERCICQSERIVRINKMKVTGSVAATADCVPSANPYSRSIKLTVAVDDDAIRKVILKDGGVEVRIYHLYPKLSAWIGGQLPDEVNPRSHDEEAIRSAVAQAIETTAKESPEDFYLANRGSTILAENLNYDKSRGVAEIIITDDALQGIADGATTDAVLARVRSSLISEVGEIDALKLLGRGRHHLEVIVGLNSKERIDRLVLGRNTSRQVKPWSMSDFRGAFDWIRDIVDKQESPFRSKVGFEENAGRPVTVLDILSLLTLFHGEFDGKGGGGDKRKAPTVAYSSKGRMDARLNDPNLQPGYKALGPILPDILKLSEHIYAGFHAAYKEARDGKAKLGLRQGFEQKEHILPLTGRKANYTVPSGVLFPLLASMRALVRYDSAGNASWKTSPFGFFDKHGADLVGTLIEQLELLGGNPQTAGKKKPVYLTMHDRARLLLAEDRGL